MKPQTKTIFKALLRGDKITPLEALNDYGIFRLAARIAELRKWGVRGIKTKMITRQSNGVNKTFAQYYIET